MNSETIYDIDTDELTLLAREIGDRLFGSDEMAILEKKVPAHLQRTVSNILHAYEQFPRQRRELEEKIGEIRDRELGVAILQQAYLIRSDGTVESIIPQLVSLANSRDRRTRQATRQALREAAYSQIPRLQELGCRALFKMEGLSAREFVGFASNDDIPFQFRMEAVEGLLELGSLKSVDAFQSVVTAWLQLRNRERDKYKTPMLQVGDRFDALALLPEADEVVRRLYAFIDGQDLGNNHAKRMVQRALASLPQQTLVFLDGLEPSERGYSAVYTMDTIAFRSSEATLRLLSWLDDMLGDRYEKRLYRTYIRRLEGMRSRSVDREAEQELETLIARYKLDAASDPKWEEVVQDLERIRLRWASGEPRFSVRKLLSDLATEWQEGDKPDVWRLRHAFSRGWKKIKADELSDNERELIVKTLAVTSKQSPWRHSWKWLVNAYPHFRGQQKKAILDALGYVAIEDSGKPWDTARFRILRAFFRKIAAEGDRYESQLAEQWLEEIQPPGLPTQIRQVDNADEAEAA